MKKVTGTLLALTMTASLAGAALASDENCTSAPESKWMSMDAIKAKTTAAGYDVRDIEREGSCYEIKALHEGKRVELYINPEDGSIVKKEEDD